jgi:hypothetical protein
VNKRWLLRKYNLHPSLITELKLLLLSTAVQGTIVNEIGLTKIQTLQSVAFTIVKEHWHMCIKVACAILVENFTSEL